ncbi:MAG: GAF domain-containing protein [Anaerolineae bacterium]|nr:GAF domain-containing protein [Anaerolineae bacterium]
MQRIIRRVSISRRLTLVFVVGVVLVGAFGVFYGYGLNRTLARLDDLVNEYLGTQLEMHELSELFRGIHRKLEEYQLNNVLPTGAEGEILVEMAEAVYRQALQVREIGQNEQLDSLVDTAAKYRDLLQDLVTSAQNESRFNPGPKLHTVQTQLLTLEHDIDIVSRAVDQAYRDENRGFVEQSMPIEYGLWVAGAMLVLAMVVAFHLLMTSLTAPLKSMEHEAQVIAGGDLTRRVAAEGRDEITALAVAFNEMADRIVELVGSLEARVTERTRALETVAEVGRETAGLRDLDRLFGRVVSLARDRLGFYHAQIFLLDDVDAYAMLRASTGDMGRYLLAQGHKVRVGSPTPVGHAAAAGQAVIATEETALTTGLKPDPTMPETRAQIALPLRVEKKILGVLDLHSRDAEPCDEQAMNIFETLADQLAAAITVIRLQARAEGQERELERLRSQLARREWGEFIDTYAPEGELSYRYNLSDVIPVRADALTGSAEISIPVRLGSGEVVGVLQASRPEQTFSADETAVVQAVAERLGLAIENARLFQNTQAALRENAQLYEGSARINAAQAFDEILEALRQGSVVGSADAAALALFDRPWVGDAAPDWVEMVAFWARPGVTLRPGDHRYTIADFPSMSALPRDAVYVIEDIETHPALDARLRALYRQAFEVRGVLFAPLTVGGRWIGWVNVMRYEPTAYTGAELRRLEALCAQAAVSIQSQLRLQETQKRAERERVLRAISDRMQSAIDMDELMRITAEELNRALEGSQTLVHMGDAAALLNGQDGVRGVK